MSSSGDRELLKLSLRLTNYVNKTMHLGGNYMGKNYKIEYNDDDTCWDVFRNLEHTTCPAEICWGLAFCSDDLASAQEYVAKKEK
jgi:hypothetical protein